MLYQVYPILHRPRTRLVLLFGTSSEPHGTSCALVSPAACPSMYLGNYLGHRVGVVDVNVFNAT